MPAFILLCSVLVAACTVAPDAGPAPEASPAAPAADYEATLTRILTAVVTTDGLVDYDRLAADLQAEFDSVKAAVAQRNPVTLATDAQKLAFFLNAYNVWMLDNILGAPAVTNIAADNRFEAFFQTPFRVAGFNMTLNQLENGVLRFEDVVDGLVLPEGLQALRPSALDPRIHVGLNCAALSCPKLRREAFTPARVDAQLDAALADFANDDRLAAVDGSAVTLSSLLDWFGADFDASGMPTGDYFLAAMSPSRPDFATIQPILDGRDAAALRAFVEANADVQFGYDWTVNRAN
ncbi:MAG: DUF547 domain-containing protein [Rhodothermaceae bacterium]|nr:DUF547 domain-containing protein [Rhodothermaceae bacterium]